jgi:endonuclease-3
MQMRLDFESSPILSRVRDRLIAALGPRRPDLRLAPVAQLIKAMLSARTRDETSWAAFVRLKRAYPDWAYLAEASSGEVERVIDDVTHAEKKAVYIPATLRLIEARIGRIDLGLLANQTAEQAMYWLRGLPGVGAATAAMALNFSTLNMRVMVVDTHVHRVCKRLGLVGRSSDVDQAYDSLMSAFPENWAAEDLFEMHWLLKGLGQAVCRHEAPRCGACPLAALCPRIDAEPARPAEVTPFRPREVLALRG